MKCSVCRQDGEPVYGMIFNARAEVYACINPELRYSASVRRMRHANSRKAVQLTSVKENNAANRP